MKHFFTRITLLVFTLLSVGCANMRPHPNDNSFDFNPRAQHLWQNATQGDSQAAVCRNLVQNPVFTLLGRTPSDTVQTVITRPEEIVVAEYETTAVTYQRNMRFYVECILQSSYEEAGVGLAVMIPKGMAEQIATAWTTDDARCWVETINDNPGHQYGLIPWYRIVSCEGDKQRSFQLFLFEVQPYLLTFYEIYPEKLEERVEDTRAIAQGPDNHVEQVSSAIVSAFRHDITEAERRCRLLDELWFSAEYQNRGISQRCLFDNSSTIVMGDFSLVLQPVTSQDAAGVLDVYSILLDRDVPPGTFPGPMFKLDDRVLTILPRRQ